MKYFYWILFVGALSTPFHKTAYAESHPINSEMPNCYSNVCLGDVVEDADMISDGFIIVESDSLECAGIKTYKIETENRVQQVHVASGEAGHLSPGYVYHIERTSKFYPFGGAKLNNQNWSEILKNVRSAVIGKYGLVPDVSDNPPTVYYRYPRNASILILPIRNTHVELREDIRIQEHVTFFWERLYGGGCVQSPFAPEVTLPD